MKTFMKYLFCFFMVCAVGMMAQAADKSVNRKMGYFDNTRTVLLLLPQSNDRGSYATAYIAKEMDAVFRYPYYRKLDTADYAYKSISPAELPAIAEETGADIVVLPVVTRWVQRRSHPISIFFDIDPVVETQVVVDVYSCKNGEGVRDDQAVYYEREEESSVRNRYIMDEVMKRLWKKFPYRRVPTDVEAKLSETVHADKDNTPAAAMNK
mgnify:FL=1